MQKVDIVETDLYFDSLSERGATDMVVIHHTGCNDIDASAEQIHGWHKSAPNYWAGIGYHYVVRKDGTIERGRPEWAIGSHAYGENYHTIGIHFSGDFMQAEPTEAQIEKGALLIADICTRYGIPIDRDHVVGHGELMSTSCPGISLQQLLDDGILTGKAIFYQNGNADAEQPAEGSGAVEGARSLERFNTIPSVPAWAQPTIVKMVSKGFLGGGGIKDEEGNPADLDLSIDMLRIFVINDRAGVYGD